MLQSSNDFDEPNPIIESLVRNLLEYGYPIQPTYYESSEEIEISAKTIIVDLIDELNSNKTTSWLDHTERWRIRFNPQKIIVLHPTGVVPEVPTNPAYRLVSVTEEMDHNSILQSVLNEFVEKTLQYLKAPGVTPDNCDGEDLINIKADAYSLANLVCHEDKSILPLAIAIFGDWGSGKSFFMNQMGKAIKQIAHKRIESDLPKGGQIPYFDPYVQITFNAWHYMESNLWASLASHIFQNLYSPYENDTTTTDKETRAKLLKQKSAVIKELDEKREEHLKLEKGIQAKENTLKKKRKQFESNQSTLTNKETLLGSLRKRELFLPQIWDEVKSELIDSLKEIDDSVDPDDIVAVENAVKGVGTSANTLRSLFQKGFTGYLTIGAAIFTAASVLLACFSDLNIGDFLTPAYSAIAGLVPVAALVARRFNKLTSAQKKIVQNLKKAQSQKLEETEAEFKKLKKQDDIYRKSIQSVEAELDKLNKEIENTYSLKKLIAFLENKSVGESYTKHLGILALLKNDLRELSQLMKTAEVETEVEFECEMVKLQPIKRIILFIDDLDRCPPDRVVEVLQAIHLLLALDLFVVIVGVDARWIERCLRSHFKKTLQQDGHNEEDLRPINYLEKIFQFPYWLAPLHRDSDTNYLLKLLDDAGITKTNNSQNQNSTHPEDQQNSQPKNSKNPEIASISNPNASSPYSAEIEHIIDNVLDWSPSEISELNQLSLIAGNTPRSIKRFFNLYRMIRTNPTVWPQFTNWREGDRMAPWFTYGLPLALCNTRIEIAQKLSALVTSDASNDDANPSLCSIMTDKLGEHPHRDAYAEQAIQQYLKLPSEIKKNSLELALKYSFHGHLMYNKTTQSVTSAD